MFKRQLYVLLFCFTLIANACVPIQPVAAPATSAPSTPVADSADLLLDAALPADPSVRTGTLENGLTYFIRRNTEPANRIELRLAINAGSVQEDDDQKGLAHLLEHMMFNGTRRFPEHELIEYLESIGMRFGADLNAYTSFDETVYMLQVPTDDPEILGKGLDVLEDWAGYATLDPAEIDLERGVVVEEWRLRDQGAQGRITNQWFPFLLAGSKYAERLPIGDMEVVRNAPAETVRSFYETWYRPDLMAVVAVGDFDVEQMETMIQERFSSLPVPENPAPRTLIQVVPPSAPRTLIITDPEYPYAVIDITTQRPAEAFESAADLRQKLLVSLSNQMLNARFDELSRQNDAPFVYASGYENDLVRPVATTGVSAQVAEDKLRVGMTAIVTELERVRQHGFTDTELARAKQDLLRNYEQAYRERDTSDSATYADEYVRNYLTAEAFPGIAVEYALAQRFLPEITLVEVNQQAVALADNQNRGVLVIAPEKEGLVLPTADELTAVFAEVQAQTIEPYVDTVTDAALMAQPPAPAAIVNEEEMADLGITEIELENGVRVLLKPTDFKQDEILFSATSPGGSSLVADEDFAEATYISNIVSNSGVGDFTYNELTRLLAGKVVSVAPYIGDLEEGLQGNASNDDLETLFQLIHLYATAPRVDDAAFASFQDQIRTFLQNRSLSPDAAFGDAINQARYGDSIRYQVIALEEVDTFDLEQAFAIYQDRFSDMSDFTFIFVGNFDVAAIKVLAQTYLGTLPGDGRGETWQDVTPDPPTEKIETAVYQGQDEQSQTYLQFDGFLEPTPENELRLHLLGRVPDIRLLNELREARSAAYATSAGGNLEAEPDATYSFFVWFGSDPQRVDELVEATWAEIADLQTNGPTDVEMSKVKEQVRREHETDLEENDFWLATLTDYASYPDEDLASRVDPQELLDAVSAEDIQTAAQDYLLDDQYIKVVLYPAAYQE